MCNPTSAITYLLGAMLLLIGGTNVEGDPTKIADLESVNPYEQTHNGITVRIEKIGISHVFNVKGWLRKHGGSHLSTTFEPVPFQVVHVYVSAITDEAKVGKIEHSKVQFELAGNDQMESATPSWDTGGVAHFAPPTWQKQLRDIKVTPHTKSSEIYLGCHVWDAVNPDAKIADLFPAELKIRFTTTNGENIEFVFSKLQF